MTILLYVEWTTNEGTRELLLEKLRQGDEHEVKHAIEEVDCLIKRTREAKNLLSEEEPPDWHGKKFWEERFDNLEKMKAAFEQILREKQAEPAPGGWSFSFEEA